VVSARIASLVSSLHCEGEVDPFEARDRQPHYDWDAWERLCRGESDRRAEFVLLSLPDEVVREASRLQECRKLFDELGALGARRVAPRYAYIAALDFTENRLRIEYATSYGFFDAFERLRGQYAELIQSLNHMLWDNLRYIEYAVLEARVADIRRKVLEFYSRIPAKYIDVLVFDDEVQLFVPQQLRGRIIGRGGATVNELQQLLGRHVSVITSPSLTELYEAEHPELPKNPEVFQLVAQLIPILKELERKGVTMRQIERVIEEMEKPEEEGAEG
jgi:transcription antitermination factor NusA-like protein